MSTKEWDQVQDLIGMIDELETCEQQDFIQNLFDHLDPNEPFLDQLSQRQLDWLQVLHAYYVEGDEDAFKDI